MKSNKIIIIVVVAVVSVYFLLGTNKTLNEDVTDLYVDDQYVSREVLRIALGNCNKAECLYKTQEGYLEGVTTLTGYYRTVSIPKESNDVVEQKAEICDAFVVSNADEMVRKFLGNYVNYYASSTMTLNINLQDTETDLSNTIKSSSTNKPVSIKILIPKIVERGMSSCDSIFNII